MSPFVQVAWPSVTPGVFPVVESTSTYIEEDGTKGTSENRYEFSLPSGVSSGDLVLLVFRAAGNGALTWVEDFTEIDTYQPGTTGATCVWGRVATGSESGTREAQSNSTGRAVGTIYRISGWEGTLAGGVAAAFAEADPPNLSPGWGAANILWLAGFTARRSDWSASAPTDYGDLLSVMNASNSSISRVGMATARREREASSENPGAFGTTGEDPNQPHGATIAVRPA